MNWRVVTTLLAAWLALPAHGAVRFDVFPGYDGIVPEGSWFPFVFEISNDGPTFNGVVKVAPSQYDQSGSRLIPVELPTGTLKRLSLPVFSSARYVMNWDAQLLDERGKVVAESLGIRARKINPWMIPLAGAVSRTPPVVPNIKPRQEDLQPIIARLQPSVFPDNPIALEGLQTIYITSEKALELKANQASALLAWMHNGGHLVISVDQLVQVNGTEWLRQVLPCQLTDIAMIPAHAGLQDWLVSDLRHDGNPYGRDGLPTVRRSNRPAEFVNPYATLTADDLFEKAPMQVAKARVRDGKVLMGSANEPLALIAPRGRGQITTLLFSPELEPFMSWKNRPHFWAKLTAVPPELLVSDQYNRFGGHSIDGVFGAMIDSKQVRKLPIGWLLLLLLAYLVVIGPVDYYWLKKINRQMLTWITFPIYVALFSGLIYFIGYKLRAGETEWNELHVVDVLPLPAGESEYRGRTYASVYSPVNATYRLVGDLPFATLRGEYLASHMGAAEGSQARVQQIGNTFQADISVPVWTSQLFVCDWLNRDVTPVTVTLSRENRGWVADIENALRKKLATAIIIVDEQVYELGEIAAEKNARIPLTNGTPVSTFVHTHGNTFMNASSARQQAFGQNRPYIHDVPRSVMAASLVANLGGRSDAPGYGQFVTPPGLDLSAQASRGNAVFMAWSDDYAPIKPIYKFSPRRNHKDTLLRLTIPAETLTAAAR